MKKKSSKSTEVLLDNCENVHIDDSGTMLPSEISAATNLLDNNNTTAIKTQSPDTKLDIELPLSGERANKTLADIANEPSIFRHPPPPWYRNWTTAGIVLCVIYNLTIVLLLVMGFFKFRQS
uniref:Uncharacterized protein n=1 Tax=Bactrocera dorsalis TaxID=27457 RepID=A0A034WFP4_BACDO